ncbi:MAG: ERAP1-like C-terminal domain-containing protein, partial [Gammaproteobacteria bacterium]
LSAAYGATRLSTAGFIDAIRILAAAPHAQATMAPGRDLVRLGEKLAAAQNRGAVLRLMRELYRPRLDALDSLGAAANESAAVKRALFRTKLVRLLALDAEDPSLRAALAQRAARYIRLDGGDAAGLDESALDPALISVALAAGVRELGAPFAETLIERLLASSDAKFRGEAAVALGATDDAALGDRVRELLTGGLLRAREPTSLAFALAKRPSQRRATFDWFRANEPEFTESMSHFAQRWLPRMGAGFCTTAERDEVEEFFAPLVGKWQGAERTLAEVLEGIELCAALREAKGPEVDEYFSTSF